MISGQRLLKLCSPYRLEHVCLQLNPIDLCLSSLLFVILLVLPPLLIYQILNLHSLRFSQTLYHPVSNFSREMLYILFFHLLFISVLLVTRLNKSRRPRSKIKKGCIKSKKKNLHKNYFLSQMFQVRHLPYCHMFYRSIFCQVACYLGFAYKNVI